MHVRLRATTVSASALLLFLCGCGYHSKQSYLAKGNASFAAGRYEDAQLLYRKAIQKDARFGEAYYRLGLTDLKLGKATDAYQSLTAAVRLAPDNMDAKVRLADLCFGGYRGSRAHPRSLYDQTLKLADDLLAKDPRSVDGLRLKAELAMTDRDVNRAIDLLRRAIAGRPTDPNINLLLSQALFEGGQAAEAEKTGLGLLQAQKTYGRMYEFLYALYRSQSRQKDAENILIKWHEADEGNPAAYVQLARYYAESGRDADMRGILDAMLAKHDRIPNARFIVGEFYATIGRPQDALVEFQAGEKENSKDKLLYDKAIVNAQLVLGHRDEAVSVVNNILREQSKDEDALNVKASLLFAAGKIDEARKIYEDLLKGNDKNPTRHFNVGRVLAAKGDLNGARKEFFAAKTLSPKYYAAYFATGEVALKLGNFQEALDNADGILAEAATNRQARLLRALALEGLQRRQDARMDLERLMKENAQDVDVEYALAALDISEKRFKEAEQTYAKHYVPGQQDVRPLQGLLEVKIQEKQPEQALSIAHTAMEKSGAAPMYRQIYADVAWSVDKRDEAVMQYEQLAENGKVPSSVYVRLGSYYQSRGETQKAISVFERATELSPRDPVAFSGLANALSAAGKREEAIQAYQHCHELQPQNPAFLNNLAFLMAVQRKNLDQALTYAQQAASAAPHDQQYQDTVAWVYIRKGAPQYAVPILKRLIVNSPNDAGFHYHLGSALAGTGNPSQAREELRAALSRSPSKEDRAEIQVLMNKLGS